MTDELTLARLLKVSVPTIRRWIQRRSSPHILARGAIAGRLNGREDSVSKEPATCLREYDCGQGVMPTTFCPTCPILRDRFDGMMRKLFPQHSERGGEAPNPLKSQD